MKNEQSVESIYMTFNLNYHYYHVMDTMAWKVDEFWQYFYFTPTLLLLTLLS
jgi:hypothetical protein